MLLSLALLLAQVDETPRRDIFSKVFKDKDPERRVDALRTLQSAKDPRTVALVIAALKDPSPKVRLTAAEVLGTSADPDATAIKPLCDLLRSPKEDTSARLAAARSLVAMPYRHEAIDAMVGVIEKAPDALYNFAAELSNLLRTLSGQDFGAGKGAGPKWRSWWSSQSGRVLREDNEKRAKRKG
jgi:hypothetical protein